MEDEFTILRLILFLTMGSLVVGLVLRAGREATEQRARLEATLPTRTRTDSGSNAAAATAPVPACRSLREAK